MVAADLRSRAAQGHCQLRGYVQYLEGQALLQVHLFPSQPSPWPGRRVLPVRVGLPRDSHTGEVVWWERTPAMPPSPLGAPRKTGEPMLASSSPDGPWAPSLPDRRNAALAKGPFPEGLAGLPPSCPTLLPSHLLGTGECRQRILVEGPYTQRPGQEGAARACTDLSSAAG